MSEKKKSGGALLGAAFLMATSAIGPGFLTQTATFTGQYQESFGFVILVSVILAAIAQLNIWRVLCVTGLRGQDVSNKVLPGLGYLVSILIVFGGLVFNIGNVGGGALGFNTLLGIPTKVGYILAGLLAILVFVLKNAKSAMDTITKVLGAIMIIVIFVVINCGKTTGRKCIEEYICTGSRCHKSDSCNPYTFGRYCWRIYHFLRRTSSD